MKILIIVLFILINSSCSTLNISSGKSSRANIGRAFDLGLVAYQKGNLNDAERFWSEVVSKNSRHYMAWFLLGNVYFRTGRYDAAVNAYKTAIKFNDQDDRAWYNLALARIKQADMVLRDGEMALNYEKGQQNRISILRSKLESRLNIRKHNHVASN